MCRKLVCFVCTFTLVLAMVCGASAESEPPIGIHNSVISAARLRSSGRPAPLVSAMILVLAGMGVSMLFEKRDRED